LHLVVPVLAIAEVAYLAETRLGVEAELALLRGLGELDLEAPGVADWAVIATMVERYSDLPLGTTDASIAVLADRLDTPMIITLDRRRFGAIRSPQGRAFLLLPEPSAAHEDAAGYQTANR
jgi:predicted nucleic acid-binding protein